MITARHGGNRRLLAACALMVAIPLAWIAISRRNSMSQAGDVPERVARFSEEIQRRSELRRAVKRQAAEFGQAGNWKAVVRAVDSAANEGNASAGLVAMRAEALLRLGKLREADDDLRRAAGVGLFRGVAGSGTMPRYGAISGRDDDPVPMAALRLLGNHSPATKRFFRALLERTDPVDAPPPVARNAAWSVLLATEDPADIRQATRLAETALRNVSADPGGAYVSAVALARWRSGDNAAAIQLLEPAARQNSLLPLSLLAVIQSRPDLPPESRQLHQRMDIAMRTTFGELSPERTQALLLLRERLRRSGEPLPETRPKRPRKSQP